MLSMPTHEVIVVFKDNTEKSFMIVDFSSKDEFIRNVKKDYERRLENNERNIQDWKTVKYCTFDKEQRVIYECSIEEILKEN